jgi:selenocysteine-specific elongation factor
VKFLETMAKGSLAERLLARIHRRSSDGLTLPDAVRETGLRQNILKPVVATLVQQKQVVQAGELLVAAEAFKAAWERAVAVLDTFHKANPLVAGISKEELREKLGLQAGVLEAVLNEMVREKKVEVAGEQVKLAGRGVALKDDEAKAKQEIEKAFSSAGLKVPTLKEVLASLSVDKNRAQKLVTLLLRDRVLVKLTDDLVFHQTAIQGLRQILAEYKTKSQKIDVAKFKDLTGISRKYAIPLLEYLDRERVTRRVGDERVIL